jgi:1-acyl-sn-glycerol-3-phosphate acyltransferase
VSEATVELEERQQPVKKADPVLPEWAIRCVRRSGKRVSDYLFNTRYRGLENIQLTDGLIIVSNHQTYLDPIWVGLPVDRPMRYLAWSEAFDWPFVGMLMNKFGAWPINIDGRDPSAVRRSIQWLKRGGGIVIFPEGGRCEADGVPLQFKTGAVRMALEANVPVLPVTINGGHRVWPKGQAFPRFKPIDIIYHPIHRVTMQPGEDTRQCARRETEKLSEIITSALTD